MRDKNRYVNTIIRALICTCAIVYSNAVDAQVVWQWVNDFSNASPVESRDVVSESSGNNYAVGHYSGDLSAHFILNQNGTPDFSTPLGVQDGFVAKHDITGQFLWAFRIGSAGSTVSVEGIDIDINNNIYVTGFFQGSSVNFQGVNTSSSTLLNSNSNTRDAFLAKYNDVGELLWVVQGSSADEAIGYAVSTDNNRVYLTGSFQTALLNLTGGSGLTNSGGQDMFLASYDLNGNQVWERRAGNYGGVSGDEYGNDIVSNGTHVFLIGHFDDSTRFFDPIAGNQDIYPITTSVQTVFLAGYNAGSGELLWTDRIASTAENSGEGIDSYGQYIAITGGVNDNSGSVEFPGIAPITFGANSREIFTALIDTSSGSPVTSWVDIVMNTNALPCFGQQVRIDGVGEIYSIGSFRGTANFDGGASPVSAAGGRDVFVVRYDISGNFQWVTSGGSPNLEKGMGVSVDGAGGVYAAGAYSQSADFDTITTPNTGSINGFVARIGDCSYPLTYGTASASSNVVCPGDSIDLIVSGNTGVVQWEESLDQGTSWSDVAGGDNDSIRIVPSDDTVWFRPAIYFPGCPREYNDTLEVVYENTAPVITCPPDQTEYADASCEYILPDYTTIATFSDNCPGFMVDQSPAQGSIVNTGITAVTLTITDTVGLTATCTFNVEVLDTINPAISCPSDISQGTDPGTCGAVVSWTAPTPLDNCSGVTLAQTQGPASGSVFPVGITMVEYVATDASGNTDTCSFNVVVNDTEVPAVNCPPGTIGYVDTNCTYDIPDFVPSVISSDNCGISTVTQSPVAGTTVGLGSTTVTITAEDVNGNTAFCTLVVDVQDTITPVIACPGDTIGYTDTNCEYIVPDYTGLASTSDNCTTPTVTQNPVAGSVVNEGTTLITLTSTDAAGNFKNCSFNLTVYDTLAPSVTCPGDQTEYVDGSCTLAIPDYTALGVGTDNCSSVSFVQNPVPGTNVSKGTYTIWLIGSDTSANVDSCSFTMTVLDSISPTITCPGSQTGYVDNTCSFVVPDFRSMAVTSDNCAVDSLQQSPQAGSVVSWGLTSIELTVLDSSGNSSSCTFDLNVLDTINPIITFCTPDIVTCDSVVSWSAPTGIDSCSAVTVTQSQGAPPGSTFPVGTSNISYAITDASGNTVNCSFTVEVLPVIDPYFYVDDSLCQHFPVVDLSDSVNLNIGEVDTFYTVPSVPSGVDPLLDPSDFSVGTYDVIHVVTNAACADSATLTLELLESPDMSMNVPDTICAATDTVHLNNWFGAQTTTGGSWSGMNVMNDSVWLVDGLSGYYMLSYSVGIGPCVDTVQFSVYVAPDVDPSWSAPPPMCDSDSMVQLLPYVTGTPSGAFSGPGVNQYTFDPNIGPGSYNVTYTVGQGSCQESSIETVTVVASPVSDAGPDVEICDTTAQLAANAANGTGEWTGPAGVILSNTSVANPVATLPGQGTYDLVWTVSNSACARTDTMTITYWDLPTSVYAGPDQELDYQFHTDLDADVPVPSTSSGTWALQNGAGVVLAPNNTFTEVEQMDFGSNVFIWSVQNGNCPVVVDTVVVYIDELHVPAGFSPNGDNINDKFVIPGLENAVQSEFVVINRWGTRVFIDSDYRNNWDGRNNSGKDLPQDTYFYELKVDDEYVFTGYVVLKR